MFVDTRVAITLLDADDPRHEPTLTRLAREPDPKILSSTWGEAMIAPYAKGERQIRLATEILDTAFERVDLDREIIETAVRLQGRLVRKGMAANRLPMLDAVVVAAAIVHDDRAMTMDRTWPLTELRVKQRVVVV